MPNKERLQLKLSCSKFSLLSGSQAKTIPKINNRKLLPLLFLLDSCKIEIMTKGKVLNEKSIELLEKYLNNASHTGYEWEGQKLWMEYLKPYVDEFITDTYGTAVGVINPKAKYKVVI